MDPTPEQLQRAAELAPRVAAIAGLPHDEGERGFIHILRGELGYWTGLLDPRAFQAVLLALPPDAADQAVWHALPSVGKDADPITSIVRRFLTPSGMLAFYEALVDADPTI